jgi:hypothetical protein
MPIRSGERFPILSRTPWLRLTIFCKSTADHIVFNLISVYFQALDTKEDEAAEEGND